MNRAKKIRAGKILNVSQTIDRRTRKIRWSSSSTNGVRTAYCRGNDDRSEKLPGGGVLEQSDATGWIGMFCLNLMHIALELSGEKKPTKVLH
jgi:hypothetical protein